jgi:hypothetical protein
MGGNGPIFKKKVTKPCKYCGKLWQVRGHNCIAVCDRWECTHKREEEIRKKHREEYQARKAKEDATKRRKERFAKSGAPYS